MHFFVPYKTHYMKGTPAILPKNLKILKELGEQIQLARLRRKLQDAGFVLTNKGWRLSPAYDMNPNEMDNGHYKLF